MGEVCSGTIAITVVAKASGRYVCEARLSGEIGHATTKSFHGQTANHAMANALENLACVLRNEAEAGQHVSWEAVDRSPAGTAKNKRFHVILHYERLADEESKFDALHNTLLGNVVVENAEITII